MKDFRDRYTNADYIIAKRQRQKKFKQAQKQLTCKADNQKKQLTYKKKIVEKIPQYGNYFIIRFTIVTAEPEAMCYKCNKELREIINNQARYWNLKLSGTRMISFREFSDKTEVIYNIISRGLDETIFLFTQLIIKTTNSSVIQIKLENEHFTSAYKIHRKYPSTEWSRHLTIYKAIEEYGRKLEAIQVKNITLYNQQFSPFERYDFDPLYMKIFQFNKPRVRTIQEFGLRYTNKKTTK